MPTYTINPFGRTNRLDLAGITTVSGALTTLVELIDTPSVYDNGKYLKSTTDGTEWATVSGTGGGTSNHSELNELDYASAGHTGFAPTAHSHTESNISDLDKYTQSEVDTISGSLNTKISGKSDTGHTHDDRYYTESEVDTISGSLNTKIDGKADTSHSHTESDISNLDKYTEAEVDTISGSLNTKIDGKADTVHIHDDRYYTESEVDTISGSLNTKIEAKPDTLLELTDTPAAYSTGLYLKSTTDGTEWATVSGSGGTSNHSELNELDYASAGHTGFAASSHSHTESDISDLDKYTETEVDTISGSLNTKIDGKADTIHTHDDRYYMESEVDTISGSLQTNIDGKSATGHIHDDRYYTESETDTISGSLNTKIEAKPDTLLELTDTPAAYDNGKFLKSTTDGTEWTTVSGAGGGGITWNLVSTNTNASNDNGYLLNASGGAITLTLLSTPSVGDVVGACDVYNKATTDTITIGRNGSNIEGVADDLIIDVDGAGFTLVYTDATRGWEIVGEISHGTSGSLSDEVYGAGWNGVTSVAPSKNAVYDKIETMGGGTPDAHKDSHDPNDGSDALDTADGASIAGVQVVGTGTSHSFSRADHVHGIAHSITDNALVTMDSADAGTGEYAKFTANGLEGKTVAELLSDISVTSGADVTADNPPQAHDLDSHGSCTLVELSADITDATLIDTADGRLSDARTPTAHETSHESGGSDELDFDQLADGTTYKLFLATERTKLTGIEENADVTDSTNVNASVTRPVVVKCIADDTALSVADGVTKFTIPIELNGMSLISVGAHVYTVSSNGLPTFQIHNLTGAVDMLSTVITIDATEKDSKDATTAAVIDTDNDDVATGDELRFDCDVAGTGTKGMEIRMGFN